MKTWGHTCFFFFGEERKKRKKNENTKKFLVQRCAQYVICMKVHHEHRKTHDFINRKGSFDRESLVAL